MRWIVSCLLVAGLGLGVSSLAIRYCASKPSDPNLAELGLADDLGELSAPAEPEAVPPAGPDSPSETRLAGVIDLFAKPISPLNQPAAVPIDHEIIPTAYIDAAGVIELDSVAHQFMPLCSDSETGPAGIPCSGHAKVKDRMPRCEELPLPRLPAGVEKPR